MEEIVTARKSPKKVAKRAPKKKKAKATKRALVVTTAASLVREAVRRYAKSDLVFAHGTTDPVAEAAFLLCETLGVHPAKFDRIAEKSVSVAKVTRFRELIAQRIATRKPAAYLVNKMYMLGQPFYVDERVIVPRSFLGELLDAHFDGGEFSLIDDPSAVQRVLDLCTGSGCLAILAAQRFPNARVDSVDLSADALGVAARNVADYGLEDRVMLRRGDLYGAIGNERYDLIITNPPYVDADGMAALPRECLYEPKLAFDGGVDGLDLVRRILGEAKRHLTPDGGLLCEIGRGRQNLDRAYPSLPLLWLETEDSEGEVFWLEASTL
jgi:ribosomal protein L3 glutamine methyltransferase